MRKRKLQHDKRNGGYFVWIRREGIKRYFPFGTNKKLAERALDQLEKDIAAGRVQFVTQETTAVTLPDGETDMRIEELAVRYLEWVKVNRSPGTFALRKHYILRFLEFIGEAMLSEVTRIRLEEFYAREKAEHSRTENGGNEALCAVKAMLRWGEEMEICNLPVRKFPTIRRAPAETKRLSHEDLNKILEAATDEFGDMMLFGLLTGLRPKELMELQRSNLLFSGNGAPYIVIERHKTSRSARTPRPRSIPLCSDAHSIVVRQLERHPKAAVIFPNSRGELYTRYVLKTRMRRLCKKAGTSRIYTPYALRHTFASMESDAGTETTGLARLMGHSTTRTLERYVVNTFEAHQAAVEALQNRVRRVRQAAEKRLECATGCATGSPETRKDLPP
jgi:integrase